MSDLTALYDEADRLYQNAVDAWERICGGRDNPRLINALTGQARLHDHHRLQVPVPAEHARDVADHDAVARVPGPERPARCRHDAAADRVDRRAAVRTAQSFGWALSAAIATPFSLGKRGRGRGS